MSYRTKLFEFLYTLNDVQIKKYSSLASRGIGPDARLNAQLVFTEVDELLALSEQLLDEIETPPSDNLDCIDAFNQIKFYIEQEYRRAYAGWLLSENNIHSTVKDRVDEQLAQLKHIGSLLSLDFSAPSKPVTTVQKQCEHDSAAIAKRILDLALLIKTDPEAELPQEIPIHARIILKANAKTRYQTFDQEITNLHQACSSFLESSELSKSSSILEAKAAKQYETQHQKKLQTLLERYKKLHPESPLFSEEHQLYKIGSNPEETKANQTPAQSSSCNRFALFGLAGGTLLVGMLFHYFAYCEENSLGASSKLGL